MYDIKNRAINDTLNLRHIYVIYRFHQILFVIKLFIKSLI